MKALMLLAAAYLVTGGLQPTTKAVAPPRDATPWTIIDASLPRIDDCPCGASCPGKAAIVEVVNVAPKAAEQCTNGSCGVASNRDHAGPIRHAIRGDGEGPVRRVFNRRERGRLFGGRCRGC